LAGCFKEIKKDGLYIFPGTHSKHVFVKNGIVENINTYMTGEFFELLAKTSVLSKSMLPSGDIPNDNELNNFKKGVIESNYTNILHTAFLARTNDLFEKTTKVENYWYLSGLLIGTELAEVSKTKMQLIIVGNDTQINLYSTALKHLGLIEIREFNSTKALINGQLKVYHLFSGEL